MKSVILNLIIFVAGTILSIFSAYYFGAAYHYFYPFNGTGFFLISDEVANMIIGIFFAYPFFTFLLFTLWGRMKKYIWAVALVVLPALGLLVLGFHEAVFYLFMIIGVVAGFVFGWFIRKGIDAMKKA